MFTFLDFRYPQQFRFCWFCRRLVRFENYLFLMRYYYFLLDFISKALYIFQSTFTCPESTMETPEQCEICSKLTIKTQ